MKISVIVPVYNSEKYLDECMLSILKQTYTKLEIILINDGSTDKSGMMCDKYAEEDSRVKVFHIKNGGQAAARNLGIRQANGELIAFVDSDDVLEKTMYEKLIRLYCETGSMFTMCGCYRFSDKGKRSEEALEKAHFKSNTEVFNSLALPMIYPAASEQFIIPSVWRSLYVKEVITKNNICFPNERDFLGEDLIFNLQYLLKAETAGILNENLYGYRENAASFTNSHSFNHKRLISIFNMADKIKQILEDSGLFSPDINKRLLTRVLDNVSVVIKLSVFSESFTSAKGLMKTARENNYVKSAFEALSKMRTGFTLKLFCFLMRFKMYFLLYLLIGFFVKVVQK